MASQIPENQFCCDCDYLTDEDYELDPLGQWGHCKRWNKEVLMDTYSCSKWIEVVLVWRILK